MTIIQTDNQLREILLTIKTIAVIGAKPNGGPAESIPAYLHQHGYNVIPVNLKRLEVAGIPSVATLDDAGPVDAVVFFRRSEAIPGHRDEMLHAKPQVGWMQLDIRNPEEAAIWDENGIDVVQDRCIMVEHRRLIL
jgi:predicted CoA-binding protein